MRLAVAGLLACMAATAAAEPRTLDPRAQRLLERGVKAFEDGQYQEAARAFEAGHEIDPHPAFYFPWAEAVRRSGDCAKAVPLYQKALETASSPSSRRLVREPLRACEQIVARSGPSDKPPGPGPEPPPEAAPTPAPRSPPAPPPPRRTERRPHPGPAPRPRTPEPGPFYLDPIGDALAGGALVSLAIGIVSFGSASTHEQRGRVAPTLDEARREWHDAGRSRTIGTVAASAAVALAVGAGLRWLQVVGQEGPAASAWLDRDGAGVVVGARF